MGVGGGNTERLKREEIRARVGGTYMWGQGKEIELAKSAFAGICNLIDIWRQEANQYK